MTDFFMRNQFMYIKQINFLILLFSSLVTAQNQMEVTRSIIDTLTSPYFAGRGYTNDGMDKTANYLASEFQNIGIKKLGTSYFQEFSMPINVIQNAELTLNGKKLRYGYDFIAKPNSKGQYYHKKDIYLFRPNKFSNALKSKSTLIDFIQEDMIAQRNKHIVFPPYTFDVDSLNQYYKHWASVYRPKENQNRSIFFFTKDKLTSSLSQTQDSISAFIIKSTFYSDSLTIDDYKIKSQFTSSFKAKNIIGKIDGTTNDSLIVITAHYDHLGKIGNTYFPGANDNASGVAFLLELANYFSKHPPKYTLIFIAFTAEEAGLVGSSYFVKNPLINLSKIRFLLNFDIMGTGEDGIQIVNSSIFTKEYEHLNQINSKHKLIKQIKRRGEACNSDHCPFHEKGIPSFFIYTLGDSKFYHDVYDKADSLSLSEFEDLQKLFIEFIQTL